MIQDLESYLTKSPTTRAQKAQIWDAFDGSANEDDLASKLEGLSIPKSMKAELWDMKASLAGPVARAGEQVLSAPEPSGMLDKAGRFVAGAARSLNPMNLVNAGIDVAGSQLDALSQGDMTGLIPFAPMGRRMAQASADRIGEATRLAVDEGDLLGAAGQAGAAVPMLGDMASGMGQRAADTGDYAGMAGELTGIALGPKVGSAAIRTGGKMIRPIVKGLRKAAPFAKEVVKETAKDWIPGVRQYERVKNAADKVKASTVEPAAPKPAPEPAPTATNPPAKPSSVPETARDVDSALRSLDKASQARLKHVVKKAESKVETPKGDVVYAPPAFKGQQSGGTRARFEHQAKRQAKLREDAIKADAQKRANELGMKVRELKQSGKTPAEIRETIASETGFDADSVSQLVNIALKGSN